MWQRSETTILKSEHKRLHTGSTVTDPGEEFCLEHKGRFFSTPVTQWTYYLQIQKHPVFMHLVKPDTSHSRQWQITKSQQIDYRITSFFTKWSDLLPNYLSSPEAPSQASEDFQIQISNLKSTNPKHNVYTWYYDKVILVNCSLARSDIWKYNPNSETTD